MGVGTNLGVARLGTSSTDFHDRPLGQSRREWLLVPVIGVLSPPYMRMLVPEVPVLLREVISKVPMALRGLLVINNIFDVNWEATFQDIKMMATGR